MDSIKNLALSDKLGHLKGNPEKLLYLRWQSPRTRDEIEGCLDDLINDKLGDNGHLLDPFLKETDLPMDHFLSLGFIRTTVFDEDYWHISGIAWIVVERIDTHKLCANCSHKVN